ncbi:unnamed protein product, partial [Rotaria magnacalcarata]
AQNFTNLILLDQSNGVTLSSTTPGTNFFNRIII